MEDVILILNTLLGSVSSSEPDVILGAVVGSMIFVTSADDFNIYIRTILFIASFFIGILSAEFTTTIVSHWIVNIFVVEAAIPLSIGATISSVASVRLLMFLCIKPAKKMSLLDFFIKRGNRDE
ncbi:putative holin [Nissabacter sp. SGAir0207]|uniref:putative holin n=1 Tax=Nissabacter sp. SGAir0207 TaxID=2126321 RepID=UPI0010CD4608|nr:hypothetical protein C1N62_02630 [Nissabacter sp. SGAir0207]